MSRWRRFKNWVRGDMDGEADDDINAADALREFVYLDDVSVDSLVASVRGGVLDQIKQTTGTELQSELGGTLGSSIPVLSADVRSRRQTTSSKGLETLRRAGIQARFRELHQIVDQRRLLRPRNPTDELPRITSVAELRAYLDRSDMPSSGIRVSALRRGDIVEVDVELGPEPLFRMVSAMSQALDLWPENPGVVGLDELANAEQIHGMSTMLSRMLGGLVPLRSRAVDLEVIDLDGELWLLPSAILEGLPQNEVDRRSLEVVGVVAADQFWKDQRRVLFAGARYRVMARLAADGASRSWNPVKMVDAFKGLVPGLAEAIDQLAHLGREQVNEPAAATPQLPPPAPHDGAISSSARLLVEAYGKLLGERVGLQVTEDGLEEAGLIEGAVGDLPTLEQSRAVLDPVTQYIQRRTGAVIDPVVVSDTRLEVYRALARQSSESNVAGSTQGADRSGADPLLIEVEFVAIYW